MLLSAAGQPDTPYESF